MIGPDDADRALWVAVMAQTRDDIADEPFGSTEYRQAEAFLTADSAYWHEARAQVTAHLGVHGDDICRAGMRWCNARRLKEGFPPLATRPAHTSAMGSRLPTRRALSPTVAAPKAPLPRLVAIPAPEPPERKRSTRNWRSRWEFNPFLPLPSELKKAG
jgi:hypothetical protein